jgi:hypothetical protein
VKKGFVRSLNGAIVAIKSLIEISRKLVNEGAQNIFPKHYLNNAVENVFSQSTQRYPKVDSLQFLTSLKAISLTHYTVPVRGSSYRFDESSEQSKNLEYYHFMKEFVQEQEEELRIAGEREEINAELREISNMEEADELFANDLQEYGFQRECARIINANAEKLSQCTMCSLSIRMIEFDDDHKTLSCDAIKFFTLLEYNFRVLSKKDENDKHHTAALNEGFEFEFASQVSKIEVFDHCPGLKRKLIDDFIALRIRKLHRRRLLHKINPFSSKGLSSAVVKLSDNAKKTKKSTKK